MSVLVNSEGRAVLEANELDCLVQWLTSIRRDTEEYDTVPQPQLSCDEEPDQPLMHKPLCNKNTEKDDIFDKILSQIGLEIYKLDEYQKKIGSVDPDIVAPLARTIVNMFDVCLYDMRDDTIDDEKDKSVVIRDSPQECNENISVQSDGNYSSGMSECGVKDDSEKYFLPVDSIFDSGRVPPVPPRRKNRKNSQSSSSSIYENLELLQAKSSPANSTGRKKLGSTENDEDSESTLWSYKPCGGMKSSKGVYQSVWNCNGGFHRSDEILRKVLECNNDTVGSQESLDDASSQHTRSHSLSSDTTLAVNEMSGLDYIPLIDEPEYENDENIYEEITWEVQSVSTGVSVEIEWCDEPPEYVNLLDNSAYAVPPDVIAWKNGLLDPYYNDDEEDEWIAPEEALVYSKEQRPPYIIPRITTYTRPCRPQSFNRKLTSQDDLTNDSSIGDHHHGSIKDSVRLFESRRACDWSPVFDPPRMDFMKANSESPTTDRLGRILSGSNENFLERANPSILYAASSSGDSLDVEYRSDKELAAARNGKSRSYVGSKPKPPVPTPRLLPRIEQFSDHSTLMHGPVKRTKLLEAGKKARKNWSDCYLVVTHTSLMFFKDLKSYNATMKSLKQGGSPPSPTAARAAEIMPLRHATVSKCTPQHTSRYARALVVAWPSGDQILIADESPAGAAYWLQQIHQAITISENTTFTYLINNPLEALTEPTTPTGSSRGGNRVKNTKVGDSSNEDLSDSTESTGNVRAKLRKFFMRRPTVESLMRKGIYKDEPVFGRRLEEVCPETPPRIPDFVVKCIQKIESNVENLKTDGLYRASGNLSQVQKIRLQIDQNNLAIVEGNTDVHELTGSLKLFFRELKEPLIPFQYFQRILAASSIKSKDSRTKEFRSIVNSLPQCNRDTLKYLLQHLIRVTEYKEHNRMEASNLAIVFGQTLLWGPTDCVRNIAKECYLQNHVIEILLNDYTLIFGDGKS